ncbi:MAG: TetR family transcriptional regulator [Gemmatimonadetes bacterium]|nr:TetR family transcriptional regulator [Gemmatimonadota bacterium]NIO31240.1 TetR family transcriptional regulator [Gemmatimonadota bacterium]
MRKALLDAALEIVRREGVGSLTLRAVARAARVSHMAPYHHFADKAALVAAVAEVGFRGLRREMEERIGRCPDDPRARFRESGIAYVSFAVKHPNLFRVMFGPEAADAEAHPDLQAESRGVFDVMQRLLQQSQAGYAIREDDARQIGLTAWSLVHGLAMLCIDGQFGPEAANPEGAERLAYAATGVLFRGLRR